MTSAPRRPLPVARATSTVVLALVASLVLGACSLVDREPAPAATPTTPSSRATARSSRT
ncbi:hypothetical protein [Aeromicrobium sp. REDSEA-S32_B7]|uniref:hypothetical protein n=1 Tax=Aeromicrobium sp. REDSEA-S32_B7 TaxID=1811526 RepID=UPI000AE8CA35|nr:hypothetical protein [Aeromicrobium sp. REDSEA-S32_B7]